MQLGAESQDRLHLLGPDLSERLARVLDTETQVESVLLLPGGASKEAWAVDVSTSEGPLALLVRRAMGGAVYDDTLSLEQEFTVLRAAYLARVAVPQPYGYLEDLAGRDAYVMARVAGETIGRRIVRIPRLADARRLLPTQMAEQLARVHAIPVSEVCVLPGPRSSPGAPAYLAALERQLDRLPQAHPVLELGLRRLREHPPRPHGIVLVHGDFRLGNFVVDEAGLAAVLDWENAHTGDPGEDLGWALVRAWRFGVNGHRVAGVGALESFLESYNILSGRELSVQDLLYWELAGNVRWAIGCVNQGIRHVSGAERSVELAVLGRLASEVEYEVLHLIDQVG